jgi:hypothetical protein
MARASRALLWLVGLFVAVYYYRHLQRQRRAKRRLAIAKSHYLWTKALTGTAVQSGAWRVTATGVGT